MKIPDKIRVGCYEYTILKVDGNDVKLNYGQNLGLADHDKLELILSNEMNENLMEEVFLHEALHCIDNFMQTGLDEDKIDRLAKGLYTFMLDNSFNNL